MWEKLETDLENKQRLAKFDRAPVPLLAELKEDTIVDSWEVENPKGYCRSEMKSSDCIDYQPVIGILTQPVSAAKKKQNFNYTDYILEVNDNFARWGGSRTVPIPYDISEEDLLNLLPQINGVLFTGGGLDLIDDQGNFHPYYLTAKKIMMYSKYVKDVRQEEWPVLGICQGIEVIGVIFGDDDIHTLDNISIYGENRPVDWEVKDVRKESRMFQTFPDHLIDEMHKRGLALHAHSYAISIETFYKTKGLREEMKII
mmetsp:Transcript_5780/g.9905  ORF Transcript_5780/g.9905 Transcript_5780/m.9905 type:complete len:257 (-) Transcript_5780:438-1208(-)